MAVLFKPPKRFVYGGMAVLLKPPKRFVRQRGGAVEIAEAMRVRRRVAVLLKPPKRFVRRRGGSFETAEAMRVRRRGGSFEIAEAMRVLPRAAAAPPRRRTSLWPPRYCSHADRVRLLIFRLVHSLCAAAKRSRRSVRCAAAQRVRLRASGGQRAILRLSLQVQHQTKKSRTSSTLVLE